MVIIIQPVIFSTKFFFQNCQLSDSIPGGSVKPETAGPGVLGTAGQRHFVSLATNGIINVLITGTSQARLETPTNNPNQTGRKTQ